MQLIVQIKALSNGSHRVQGYHGEVFEGWALIPEGTEIPNFPFGEVEASEVDGVMTMTKWTPGEMPEPEAITPAQQRKEAYTTRAIIQWGGELLTVTEAAQEWQYYAAEGDAEKADELQVLIAQAKQSIREEFPDEEVSG